MKNLQKRKTRLSLSKSDPFPFGLSKPEPPGRNWPCSWRRSRSPTKTFKQNKTCPFCGNSMEFCGFGSFCLLSSAFSGFGGFPLPRFLCILLQLFAARRRGSDVSGQEDSQTESVIKVLSYTNLVTSFLKWCTNLLPRCQRKSKMISQPKIHLLLALVFSEAVSCQLENLSSLLSPPPRPRKGQTKC